MEGVIVSIGGIFSSLTVILRIIMLPISEHIFSINALHFFYFLKSADTAIFKKKKNKKIESRFIDHENFQNIRITARDQFFLFINNKSCLKFFEYF